MNVQFKSELVVRTVGKYHWELRESFAFMADNRAFLIMPGYLTDFASVPRWPFIYLVAGGKGRKSALVHDYLYSVQAGRDFADLAFREALRLEGHGKLVSQLMYLGVRFGGKWRYDHYHSLKRA